MGNRPDTFTVPLAHTPLKLQVFSGFDTPKLNKRQQKRLESLKKRLVRADEEAKRASAKYDKIRTEWLELTGDGVAAVVDNDNNQRVVRYDNPPRVDNELLRKLVAESYPSAWDVCIQQEIVMVLRFRVDHRRGIDQMKVAMSRHAAMYKGWIDGDITYETIVDIDRMHEMFRKKGLPFPDSAFTDRTAVRIYPLREIAAELDK